MKLKHILNEIQTDQYQIYQDLDKCLSNFEKQYEHYTGMTPDEMDKELSKQYGPKKAKDIFWTKVDPVGTKFWSEMDKMSDADELWNFIEPYNPKFLSSPSRSKTSVEGKKEWCDKYYPGVELILRIAEKKQEFAGPNQILIDDSKKNIDQWNAKGGIGILHTSAANTIKELEKLGFGKKELDEIQIQPNFDRIIKMIQDIHRYIYVDFHERNPRYSNRLGSTPLSRLLGKYGFSSYAGELEDWLPTLSSDKYQSFYKEVLALYKEINSEELNEIQIDVSKDENEKEWREFYKQNIDKLKYLGITSLDDVENKEQEIREKIMTHMKKIGDWPPRWDYFSDELGVRTDDRFENTYGFDPGELKWFFKGLNKYKKQRELNEIQIQPKITAVENNYGVGGYLIPSLKNTSVYLYPNDRLEFAWYNETDLNSVKDFLNKRKIPFVTNDNNNYIWVDNSSNYFEYKEKLNEIQINTFKLIKGKYYRFHDYGDDEWRNNYKYVGLVDGPSEGGPIEKLHYFRDIEEPGWKEIRENDLYYTNEALQEVIDDKRIEYQKNGLSNNSMGELDEIQIKPYKPIKFRNDTFTVDESAGFWFGYINKEKNILVAITNHKDYGLESALKKKNIKFKIDLDGDMGRYFIPLHYVEMEDNEEINEIQINPYVPIRKFIRANYEGETTSNILKGEKLIMIASNNPNYYFLCIYEGVYLIPKKYLKNIEEIKDYSDEDLEEHFLNAQNMIGKNNYIKIK